MPLIMTTVVTSSILVGLLLGISTADVSAHRVDRVKQQLVLGYLPDSRRTTRNRHQNPFYRAGLNEYMIPSQKEDCEVLR